SGPQSPFQRLYQIQLRGEIEQYLYLWRTSERHDSDLSVQHPSDQCADRGQIRSGSISVDLNRGYLRSFSLEGRNELWIWGAVQLNADVPTLNLASPKGFNNPFGCGVLGYYIDVDTQLAQCGYGFRSAHNYRQLAERVQELVFQSHGFGLGYQESRPHTGEKNHEVQCSRYDMPYELLQFLLVFNRLFLEQWTRVNSCAQPFKKGREFLRESMLDNRDSDVFQWLRHALHSPIRTDSCKLGGKMCKLERCIMRNQQ